jgi:hypothetical protein
MAETGRGGDVEAVGVAGTANRWLVLNGVADVSSASVCGVGVDVR